MQKHAPFLALFLAYFVLGALFAIQTPDWQSPDEPAHYNYVRQLSEGTFPLIESTDYDQAYQNELVSSRFDPAYEIDSITYEDWQPPLYYLLQTPIFMISSGSLLVMRLFSVLLGGFTVLFAYLIGLRLFPEIRWPALTMTAVVAFIPQHLAITASVNNDVLAELIIALLLYLLLVWMQFANPRARSQDRSLLLIGAILGLGLVTKATVYIMLPVVAVAVFLVFREDKDGLKRAALLVGAPAIGLGLLWWVRNIVVYPGLDVMGTMAHDAVVDGQLRTADWIADVGVGTATGRFLTTTFKSFWGQFGWMAAPFQSWVYWPLFLFDAITIVGILIAFRKFRNDPAPTLARMAHRDRLIRLRFGWLLALLAALNLLLYLGYNVTFVQHQGRYLFPALIPIAAGVVVGWQGLLGQQFADRQLLRYGFPLALAFMLIVIALYGVVTVLPSLAF